MIALIIYEMVCRPTAGGGPVIVDYNRDFFGSVLNTLFEVAHDVNGLGLYKDLKIPMLAYLKFKF